MDRTEIKAILEKQLQLLLEYSQRDGITAEDLCYLTGKITCLLENKHLTD